MSQELRGVRSSHSPRALGRSCIAVLLATLASGGVAWASAAFLAEPVVQPLQAAAGGFLVSGIALTLRALRTPRASAHAADTAVRAEGPEAGAPVVAPAERMTPVDVPDLAEAIVKARVSRLVLPFGAGESGSEAVALARRLAGRRASVILVDFGASEIARETGLIDPPGDVRIMAASPTSFAHSIHRDRSSAAHVMATDIGASTGDDAVTEAIATVLDALGEAYARTVIAVPAGRLKDIAGSIGADAAIVLPASAGGDPSIRAMLEELEGHDIGDMLLVSHEAERRRAKAA